MTNKHLLEKLMNEEPLTAAEQSQLDVLLATESQKKVALMATHCDEEELSLAWRSDLNQKLAVESSKRRKNQRVWWTLRPAIGLGLASAMGFVLWTKQPDVVQQPPYQTPIEQKLAAAHEEASTVAELQGSTIASYHKPTEAPIDNQWTEADLGAL